MPTAPGADFPGPEVSNRLPINTIKQSRIIIDIVTASSAYLDLSGKIYAEATPLIRIRIQGTHGARVTEILVLDVGTGRVDFPGIPEELGCGLHNALTRGEVILGIPVKIST